MDTAKLYFYFIDLIAEKTKDISIVVFLAMALFGIFAANLIWLVMERKLNKMVLLEKKKVIVALIIYASIVYQITFYSREAGSISEIVTKLDWGNLGGNQVSAQQVMYVVLNWLMFVPLGYLTGKLKRDYSGSRRIIMCTLISFVVSFGIECAQLFTKRGYFELTDIVINTLGGFTGVVFISAIYACRRGKEEHSCE